MKIWLDDERDPANHGCPGHLWIKTGEACIAWFVEHGMAACREISMDHDLGSGRMTGYDVITWMEQQVAAGAQPPIRIYIHTQNPVGKERMRAARFKIRELADQRKNPAP